MSHVVSRRLRAKGLKVFGSEPSVFSHFVELLTFIGQACHGQADQANASGVHASPILNRRANHFLVTVVLPRSRFASRTLEPQKYVNTTDRHLFEQLAEFNLAPEESEQARRILETLLKQGGWELSLNPASPAQTADGKPLPGNKLTPHTVGLVDWNVKLDKALLGSRLVASQQKGWNEILPYAHVLEPALKTAGSPDEEQQRDVELQKILGALQVEVPQVESTLAQVGTSLGGAIPESLKETFARLTIIAAVANFHEFDAVARENYAKPEDFAAALESYKKARQLKDAGVELMAAVAYLRDSCNVDAAVEAARTSTLSLLGFDGLLAQPHLVGARIDSFRQWKTKYVHAYRKAHRVHHEALGKTKAEADVLAPQVRGLTRLNSLIELGPPLPATTTAATELTSLEKQTWVCPDSAEAAVDGAKAVCQKCNWTPITAVPAEALARLKSNVALGLNDRMRRFKDAAIHGILQQAAESRADLQTLLQIIQAADAHKLVGLLTDDLIEFLRKLLQEQNLVQVELSFADLLDQLGAVDGERIDDVVDEFAKLLRKKLKDAKAQQLPGKRVRLFLRAERPNAGASSQPLDAHKAEG